MLSLQETALSNMHAPHHKSYGSRLLNNEMVIYTGILWGVRKLVRLSSVQLWIE